MLRRILSICVVWLSPSAVFAAEEGHGALHFEDVLGSTEFWAAVENFGLLVFLVWWFGRRPVGQFLGARRKRVEQAMADATAVKEKAEARYREYSERLGQLDEELEKLKQDIQRAAEEDKKRILADAEEAARRMRKETEALIEQHAQTLNQQLRHEVVEAAVTAAHDVLTRGVDVDDQKRLAEEFRAYLAAETEAAGAPAKPNSPAGSAARPRVSQGGHA